MTTDRTLEESAGTTAVRGPESSALESLAALRAAAAPSAPFPQQVAWARRMQKLLPVLPDLKPIRIAILGNGTLGHFGETLRFWLALEGFQPEIYIAPYGAFRQETLNSESGLYAFRPDVVWLFATGRDLFARVNYGASASDCAAALEEALAEWRGLWRQLRAAFPATILQNNFEMPGVRLFGQYDGAIPWSRCNLTRRFNLMLAEACAEENVSLFDLDHVASQVGLTRWHEERHWHTSKQPFAPDAFGAVAFESARFLGALKGKVRKCVVLDLDNTLWGGVIGDDGLAGISLGDGPEGEAFVAFQDYVKSLRSRGILVAVCSKNEEETAREPFLKHPAMRLSLDDIIVFRANWQSKVENLRDIAATLNIGMDALVFVDDNPAERQLVRSVLPEVAVPELPQDPAEFIAALDGGHYFEAASFSPEDALRTRRYHENAQREAARSTATGLHAFLQDLRMEADSGPADSFTLPRMAQLLARTNQFHPTTTRHGEAEISAFASDPRAWVRWFSLRDRFGDHGIVSVAVLLPKDDALVIDSWAMSCRVFSRGLEEFVLMEMVQAARALGFGKLIGHYLPTRKNRPVADLFQRLGFAADGIDDGASRWVLNLSGPIPAFSPFIEPLRPPVVPA